MELIRKTLIQSNLPSKKGQFSFMVGRWQPMSDIDRKVVYSILYSGNNICLGVLDAEPDSVHPLTSIEVVGKLMSEFEPYIKSKSLFVMVVPNISNVIIGSNPCHGVVAYNSNSL
jgi:hypothetical protein